MKQTAKMGCRVLVAMLCLALLISVINIPAFAAPAIPGLPSDLAGGDLGFLMDLLQQYDKVKNDEDAADKMKDYVEEKYESDESFKESADNLVGENSGSDDTLGSMNNVIDNVFKDTFTITWKVNEETSIEVPDVPYGETPVFPGDIETLSYETTDYKYTFKGWSPVVVPAKADATYTALYTVEQIEATGSITVTFVTGSGDSVLKFEDEGEIEAFANTLNPVKADDKNYTYTFTGNWSVEGAGTDTQIWTAVFDRAEIQKGWQDILTSGKVVEDYFGSIDNVMDAVQNGATVDDLMDSVQHQQKVEQDKAEAEERGEEYVEPTYTVTWKLDGNVVATQEYTYKKMIQQPTVAAMSAGKYVSWEMDYVFMPEKNITVNGETVDIVEEIVADVNGMPMNYGEYEMTYVNGVATLYINVTPSNYNEILADVLGDVRGGGATGVYKEAIISFLQSSALHMYNSKTNTIDVNGYEVFGIDGYGASQLIELLNTVQAGNYGEIISTSGIKNALLSDLITPNDIAYMEDDGVIGTYDITLGADGKQDFDVQFNIALKGNLDLIRNAAKAFVKVVDYAISTGGDLDVKITVPGALTKVMAKALNHAGVSDETKQIIVAGLSECATVGELLTLLDKLDYEQFVDVMEYIFDSLDSLNADELAILDEVKGAHTAFDLFKKYGDLLVEKLPDSVDGVTTKTIYDLICSVSYDDLAAMTQLKDADALVGSARLEAATARVANAIGISSDSAQAIVERMVEMFADFQNSIPESAQAEKAYDGAMRAITALYNRVGETRPIVDLLKDYADILVNKAPESIQGAQASFTIKKVYELTQLVNFEDLAALTQLKDADALVGSARLDAAVERVANRLNVSPARAQDIVMRMVEAFADYQNRIPDSAKAQKAFDSVSNAIDLIYNKIPEKFQDAKLTDTYKGNGVFSFAFSKTYNPGAWIKKVLDKVTITAYGRSVTLGDYVPTRDITSDVSFSVTFADLYSVEFVDEKGNQIFKGFLPYGAELAPYYSDLKGEGYKLVAVDKYGDALTTMPASDAVITVKKIADEFTVTFDVLGKIYTETFAYGEIPTLAEDLYLFDTLNFKGWAGYGFELPAVTGDAAYVAEYTADITFIVADQAYEIEVPYGETPAPEAAWVEAIADILTFKGWNTAIVPATAHATYEADLYATIRFFAGDALIASIEVKYGQLPTAPAAPSKEMDLTYSYTFKGWYAANGAALAKAVAHADYFAEYTEKAHFDAESGVTLNGSTFIVPVGEYVKNGNRWTATATIFDIILELAEMNSDVALKAVVAGNGAGADPVEVVLDNAALLNIKANATADEILFQISHVIGEEAEWPTTEDFYAYDDVYSFDLVGSKFDGGKATITVPFKDDVTKFHGYVYYVGANGAIKQTVVAESDEGLVFTTDHFSYYAINYEQYLYTVNFYDLNGNLIKTVTINTDLGQTLDASEVPAFAALADPVEGGHYVSKWKWGANKYTTSPAVTFTEASQDYDFYEVQVLTAHNFNAYEQCDDEFHWLVCACGYKKQEAHNWNASGDCVCGHHKDEVITTPETDTTEPGTDTTEPGTDTTEPGTDTTEPGTDTTEPGTDTTEPGTDTTEPGTDTTEPGTDTTEPDVTTAPDESSSEDATTDPGQTTTPDESGSESGTTPPEGSTDEGTTPDSETESDTTPVGVEDEKKNGWWIFLIVLLVIIAILIVAYILYGHNIFPKGPATEEPAKEAEPEELTDAQKGEATVVAPVVEEEIVHVEHVSAVEADALMTDAQAVNSVVLVACAATGKMGAVNVGTLNVHYEDGDKVDIDSLKAKKLIAADCKRVKILADGDLDKTLTVEANSFSLQAIKMITLVGGHAIKLQPNAPEADAANTPAEEALVEETPVEETPVEETPVEETPVEETPVEETPVEETPVEETPVEETPVEEAPAEETPVEEAPVEEAPVEEAPVEEAPAEEAPAEDTDAE